MVPPAGALRGATVRRPSPHSGNRGTPAPTGGHPACRFLEVVPGCRSGGGRSGSAVLTPQAASLLRPRLGLAGLSQARQVPALRSAVTSLEVSRMGLLRVDGTGSSLQAGVGGASRLQPNDVDIEQMNRISLIFARCRHRRLPGFADGSASAADAIWQEISCARR